MTDVKGLSSEPKETASGSIPEAVGPKLLAGAL